MTGWEAAGTESWKSVRARNSYRSTTVLKALRFGEHGSR